jgi:DNA repair exonuclease SbcCD ATPase subunit
MSASDPFLKKYREWLDIVVFEQQVIRDQKWVDLPRFSQRKQELIKELKELEEKQPDWKNKQSNSLRVLIHQLADLEQSNHSILQERSKDLKTKVDDINKRQQAVRQLRNRYIAMPNRAGKKASGQG